MAPEVNIRHFGGQSWAWSCGAEVPHVRLTLPPQSAQSTDRPVHNLFSGTSSPTASLFKMSPDHSTTMLSIIHKPKKAIMYFIKNVCVSAKFYSFQSHNPLGVCTMLVPNSHQTRCRWVEVQIKRAVGWWSELRKPSTIFLLGAIIQFVLIRMHSNLL